MQSEWISGALMALVIVAVFYGIKFARFKSIGKQDFESELSDSGDGSLHPESDFVISIEGDVVRCTRPDGNIESFQWSKLAKVEILTTSDGPFAPDMFWVYQDSEGGGAVIPSGASGETVLTDMAFELSEFDYESFISSQTSTDDTTFPVWRSSKSNGA